MRPWPAGLAAVVVTCILGAAAIAETRRLESADLLRMRAVDSVRLSPDGARIAYTVVTQDQPGRPQRQLFVMTVADGRSVRLGGSEPASSSQSIRPPRGVIVMLSGESRTACPGDSNRRRSRPLDDPSGV